MKKTFLILALLTNTVMVFAQTEPANYKAAMNNFKTYYNDQQPDSIFNMFSPKVQGISPLDKTKEMVTQLNSQLGKISTTEFITQKENTAIYKTTFDKAVLSLLLTLNSDNKIDGIFFKPYKDEKEIPILEAPNSSPYVYHAPDGDIKGTLVLPNGTKRIPVVLIIAGSGPTDRNGNSPLGVSGNTYLMIADSLQKHGIASVRYDKRNIGESTGFKSEENTSFEDMINDAEGLIKKLKADPRFSEVIVLGHSEGSLIGMVAAEHTKANAFISVSGAGRPLDEVIMEQLKAQSEDIQKESSTIMDSLKKGSTVKNVDPKLDALFRSSVQPYLISLFKYDPAKEIKKLHMPVLIVQGTTDIQVSVSDAEDLHKANPKATFKLIDGMNHVLKQAPLDRQQNMATYSDPNLPLDAQLVTSIKDFILKTKK
ncbi:MAG TPA: alpha/beta hydrolase [Flavipsychrobacter sp.]|nr:alpha/beta hydrolase [Flavipsychrobacter sp.]